MKKCNFFSLFFICSVIILLSPVNIKAASTIVSGTCGANLTWKIEDDEGKKTLIISGTGAMPAFRQNYSDTGYTDNPPWIGYSNEIDEIHIENGVTSLSNAAFFYLDKTKRIDIPATVTSIDIWAFTGCYNLKNINVEETNMNYASFNGALYNKDKSTLIKCPQGITGTYSIPATVTEIGDHAFACDGNNAKETMVLNGISQVNIPDSVKRIGERAFYDCKNIESISIPDGVEVIEDYTFYGCVKLRAIKLPKNLKRIGKSVFIFCAFEEIVFPSSIEYIGNRAFQLSGIKTIVVPDSIKEMGDAIFYKANSLVRADVYVDTATINKHLFFDCPNLKDIYIYDKTASDISEHTFYKLSNDYSVHVYKDAVGYDTPNWIGLNIVYDIDDGTNTSNNEDEPKDNANSGDDTINNSATDDGDNKQDNSATKDDSVTKDSSTLNDSDKSKDIQDYSDKEKDSSASNVEDRTGEDIVTNKKKDIPSNSDQGKVNERVDNKQKSTTITKILSGKRYIKIEWKKQAKGITGYEIQYSTDKKFRKDLKVVVILKSKACSKKLSKLKANRKYYVRIRNYRNTSNCKVYSKWSKTRSTKTR